jgi:uncharacterized protein (DUF1330 family)
MTAYMIAQVAIHDQNEYNKYVAEFRPIIQRYGGATVARGLPAEVVEGEWPYSRTVLLKFPDKEAAKRWYADPDYQRILKHRFASSTANLVLIDGVPEDK